jgi:hypothetical protein
MRIGSIRIRLIVEEGAGRLTCGDDERIETLGGESR